MDTPARSVLTQIDRINHIQRLAEARQRAKVAFQEADREYRAALADDDGTPELSADDSLDVPGAAAYARKPVAEIRQALGCGALHMRRTHPRGQYRIAVAELDAWIAGGAK